MKPPDFGRLHVAWIRIRRAGLHGRHAPAWIALAVYSSGWILPGSALHHVGETMAMAQTGSSDDDARLQRSLLSAAEQGGAGERVTARLAANLARYEQGLRCCADAGPAVLLPPPEPAGR